MNYRIFGGSKFLDLNLINFNWVTSDVIIKKKKKKQGCGWRQTLEYKLNMAKKNRKE